MTAGQPVDGYVWMVGVALAAAVSTKHPIGILAMHDVNLMSELSQRIRQPVDKERVTSEMKRRIEGSHHAEAEALAHLFFVRAVASSRLRVSRAARSHVNSLILSRPADFICSRLRSSERSPRSSIASASGLSGSK